MNTYFYSAKNSKCNGVCQFQSCSKRCLALLEELPMNSDLKVLPGGSNLRTPSSMGLRSGDIIILYAENINDIEALISIKDFFETFRVILIVGEKKITENGQHYPLSPRYTTSIDNNMVELNAVIDKMTAMSC